MSGIVEDADPRGVKDALYEQFARIGRAVSSPKRIELLDLLGQGERTVEGLAEASGMGVTNTSAHLKILRDARLVAARKDGTRVVHRLADDDVGRFLLGLLEVARSRLAEVEKVTHDYFEVRDELEPLRRSDLAERLERGDVVVLDVRPTEEFEAGHIRGAVSVPLEDLARRMAELPPDIEVVAYCRGPYCVLAPQALEVLRERGYAARRLEDGFPEWRLAGLPVAVGAGA